MNEVIRLSFVSLLASAFTYGMASLYLRNWIRIHGYDLAVYMSTTFVVAAILEVSFGLLHEYIFGWRLWEYHIMPNHHAYGTYLSPFLWPFYGVYLYFFHEVFEKKGWKMDATKAGVFTGVDAPLLEILANGLFLMVFGEFIFYYFPGELWHLTSLWVVPYYMICGVIGFFLLRFVNSHKKDWRIPFMLFVGGVLFVLSG